MDMAPFKGDSHCFRRRSGAGGEKFGKERGGKSRRGNKRKWGMKRIGGRNGTKRGLKWDEKKVEMGRTGCRGDAQGGG